MNRPPNVQLVRLHRPMSGARPALRALALVLAAAVVGCYSFAGGGLPAHVKTVAVLPFDNETAAPELPQELQIALREGLQSRLGLRDAPEERASAVVRGKVTRYEIDIPVAFSANPAQATSQCLAK